MESAPKKKKIFIYNILFLLVGAGLLLFLFKAPPESTKKLPHDEIHNKFFPIASKKEAEKTCTQCHNPDGVKPLPQGHPPKYRCLFCHKR